MVMDILFCFLRILLIPIVTTGGLICIRQTIRKPLSMRYLLLTLIGMIFIINGITLYATSYMFLNSYIKSASFYLSKLFDIQNNLLAFTVKWIGLSGCFGCGIMAFALIWTILYKNDKDVLLTRHIFIVPTILSSLALLLICGFAWANSRFPLADASVVVYTLSMPLQGTDAGTFISGFAFVILPIMIYIFAVLLGIRCLTRNASSTHSVSTRSIIALCKTIRLYSTALIIVLILFIIRQLPIQGYINAYNRLQHPQTPAFSAFYDKYFVNPHNVTITMPEQKRNLIIILLESIEIGFADKQHGGQLDVNLIPELTDLADDYVNFSQTNLCGGGSTLAGTHGTMPAIISKFNGVPYTSQTVTVSPQGHHILKEYRGLFDILNENGYNMRYLFGSDKAFAYRGEYLEQHHVEVHDLGYYKDHKSIPKHYFSGNWGIEDEKLFEFAKTELNELSAQQQPFMLGLLTVDTHFPEGYLCQQCGRQYRKAGYNRFYDVAACSSHQTAAFIDWIQQQTWYQNTTIVIMGDHPFMNDSLLPNPDIHNRYWLDIFINATATAKTTKRQFSSFDMYPTILESIGADIDGHQLGFGVSLWSDVPTLLEMNIDTDYINQNLCIPALQYEAH